MTHHDTPHRLGTQGHRAMCTVILGQAHHALDVARQRLSLAHDRAARHTSGQVSPAQRGVTHPTDAAPLLERWAHRFGFDGNPDFVSVMRQLADVEQALARGAVGRTHRAGRKRKAAEPAERAEVAELVVPNGPLRGA